MVAASRRTLVLAIGVLSLGCLVSSCSSSADSASAVGTSGAGQVFANVTMSAFDVTVENLAGQPLVDIEVTLKPAGFIVYTERIPRLGSGEKRSLKVSDFTSRDGTPLSLRVATPKEVRVAAVDVTGKKFEMTTPWKQQ